MAETAKALTALITQLADNTSGDISPQDLRDAIVTALGVYGDMYITGGVTAQSSIGTGYTKMTGWAADGQNDNVTVDSTTNKRLTPGITGIYLVGFNISFSGTASTAFTFSVHVGQAEPTEKVVATRTIGTGADTGNCGCAGILSLTANDQVEVFVKANGASKSITPEEAHFYCKLIG